jgi:hypothetical protein
MFEHGSADSKASQDSDDVDGQEDLDDAETLANQLEEEDFDDMIELRMLEQLQKGPENGNILQVSLRTYCRCPCPCNIGPFKNNVQTLERSMHLHRFMNLTMD